MEEPVRSQARLDQTKRLSNAILRRTVVNVVLFIVVYLVLFAGFMTTLGSAVSNFVYELLGYDYALHTLASNLFLVLTAIGFVAGIVLVVRSGINRALRYFDLLLDSVSDILAKSDGPVMLPGELAPTAMALNTIKATSEQNERAAKAAEDRKNELVVYLAHDIKTPLTSIIGYLTLLEESPDLPLEVRERYTGITLDKAYRLEELLDEFFEITRYNLQTIPIERSRFDAALFVNQVVDEFFPLAEGRRLNLVYEGPAELSVFADAGRVARVLNNVIKNAVAYADPGTDVRVRTGLVTAADGFVWWELTVSDQGRELSPQHLERIFETLDVKPEIANKPGATELPAIQGKVDFNDVVFRYEDDGRNILNLVDFHVTPGKTIALVGPPGAGKTTIVSLLSRFYDVSEGSVTIDGHDVRDVTLELLRRQMGVMLQDTFIFSGNVRDNIRYGKLDATDEEIEAAAKAVHAHEFIMELPDGYDTTVEERGSTLSAGQRQLIAFARVLLADPRILILDEATSNIDTRTEEALQAGLRHLLKGRTSFIIAHRLSTIENADQIFYIDHGQIVEHGTHAELLEAKGAYYRLYESQYAMIRVATGATE